jgi:hypothetical protein
MINKLRQRSEVDINSPISPLRKPKLQSRHKRSSSKSLYFDTVNTQSQFLPNIDKVVNMTPKANRDIDHVFPLDQKYYDQGQKRFKVVKYKQKEGMPKNPMF